MTLLHQAAQKAVEALKSVTDMRGGVAHFDRTTKQAGLARDAITALESALQQQPEPVAEDDPTHWKQNYFNLRHVMQDWHAQALTARFDGVPDVLLVAAEAANLFSALNAMLTQFGMDEDEWSRPTFKQAKSAIEQYLAARKKTADAPALQHQEVPREPVAWRWKYGDTDHHKWIVMDIPPMGAPVFRLEPLYASPSTTRQQEVGSAPEGFRLLPVEATDAMMYADWDVTMSDAHSNGGVSAAAWRAMVEAAPQVTYGNGHSGVGWYMHDTDYPEEGAVFLGAAAPSTPEKAGGVSDGVGACPGCGRFYPVHLPGCPHVVSASVSHPLPAQANDGGEHG